MNVSDAVRNPAYELAGLIARHVSVDDWTAQTELRLDGGKSGGV